MKKNEFLVGALILGALIFFMSKKTTDAGITRLVPGGGTQPAGIPADITAGIAAAGGAASIIGSLFHNSTDMIVNPTSDFITSGNDPNAAYDYATYGA